MLKTIFFTLFLGLTLAAVEKPNILIFFADDMGWGDVSYHGFSDIRTPHIDSLAAGGVQFSQGYTAASVCGPSRSGLLTGVYQQKLGVYGNGGSGQLNPKQPLIFKTLKAQGYKTASIGKWGVHVHSDTPLPNDNGVDYFYGFLGGAHDFLKSSLDVNNKKKGLLPLYRNKEMLPPIQDNNGYLTDMFSDEAVNFVERNSDKPFLLYLAYNAVHSPWQVPEPYLKRLDDLKVKHPDRKVFAGMALAMDDGIGRVVAKLKEKGIYENTLIFFLSDNGTPCGQGIGKNAGDKARGECLMSNPADLNGFKGDTYEGGTRIPFLVHYPKELPAGETYKLPVISYDIAATIMARLGLSGPGFNAPFDYDGVDLFPYLKGGKTERPHDTLYWRRGNDYAIRVGDMKLAYNDQRGPKTIRLFNLATDPGERQDLVNSMPERAQVLQDKFDAWDSTLAPHPVKPLTNRNFDYAEGKRVNIQSFNKKSMNSSKPKRNNKKRKK